MDKETEKKWDEIVYNTEWHYRNNYPFSIALSL